MPTKLDDSLNYLNGNSGSITISQTSLPFAGRLAYPPEQTVLSDSIRTWLASTKTDTDDSNENDEEVGLLDYDRVVFNPPATIALWKDGTKTVVKCGENDVYDPEKGLALCFMKKALGNTSRALNDILHAEIRHEG